MFPVPKLGSLEFRGNAIKFSSSYALTSLSITVTFATSQRYFVWAAYRFFVSFAVSIQVALTHIYVGRYFFCWPLILFCDLFIYFWKGQFWWSNIVLLLLLFFYLFHLDISGFFYCYIPDMIRNWRLVYLVLIFIPVIQSVHPEVNVEVQDSSACCY